ncbi:MAG: sulfatase-like hydrolase/transferase [Bacteriovoracaceae bacterium]|nr:sulfatase-like hydrolase/transferase [Bacteriovoracaceae bacterium]
MKTLIKLLLTAIFLITPNLIVFSRIAEMISKGNYVNLILFLGIWGISLIGLFSLLFHSNTKLRIFGGILVSISAFSGLCYFNISHHYMSYEDLELLWIERAQTSNALSFFWGQMMTPLALGITGLVAVILDAPIIGYFKKKGKLVNYAMTVMLIMPFPVLMGVTYIKAGYGAKGMPLQYSSISTFALYQIYEAFSPGMIEKRGPLKATYIGAGTPRNIIYIVDESIRADYIDLNNDKGLTPYLKSQQTRLANFGSIASANNCSGYSNAVLRMGATKKNLTNIGKEPLIWNYAQKAGFKTYYFDAQLKNGKVQNFMNHLELQFVDEFVQLSNVEEYKRDIQFAKIIKETIKKPGKHFIYLNKRGAHFPYTTSYDYENPKFTPHMALDEQLGKSKERLKNSYKNSVYWNVNNFFKELLGEEIYKDSIIFYTSDHGQNLMDSGIMTHCNSQEPHPTEGYVPLMVLTDNEKWLTKYQNWAQISKNKLNHFSIFPTVISELGFNQSEVKKNYGGGLEQPISQDRAFSAGPILPRFGRQVK